MGIWNDGYQAVRGWMDGWSNVATGLGQKGRDKRMSAGINFERMTWAEIDTLYTMDDVAAKYIDKVPSEGTRKWIYYSGVEKEWQEKLLDKLRKLHAQEQFKQAWTWARLYGAAFLLIDGPDGNIDPQEPLNLDRLTDVTSLTALHKWEVYPDIGYGLVNDITDPNYGMPKYYMLQPHRTPDSTYLGMRIHYSRLIRFDGARIPTKIFVANYYSHDTYLTRVYNPIRNYNASNDGLATVMQDFRMNVLTMKNIAKQLKEKGSPELIERLKLMNLTRALTNTTILQEDEKLEQFSASLAGVKDANDAVSNRLVAALDGMPHDQVLGEGAKGGLGAKGDLENRNYYDAIESQAKVNFIPQIEQLTRILAVTKMFAGMKDTWEVNLHSLWQMDDKEKSAINYQQAQADQIYIDAGVLDPTEVRKSRFGGDKYSLDTTLDEKVTKYQDKLSLEAQKAGKNPGEPPAPKPGDPDYKDPNAKATPDNPAADKGK